MSVNRKAAMVGLLLAAATGCRAGNKGAATRATASVPSRSETMTTPNARDLDADFFVGAFARPVEGSDALTGAAFKKDFPAWFRAAGPVTAWPQGGEEVWFGQEFFLYDDGRLDDDHVFLRLRPGRGGAAGPGGERALDYTGEKSALKPDGMEEEKAAYALLAAVQKGEVAPDNGATRYVKRAAGSHGALLRSDGVSAILLAKNPTYLRQSGDRILIVERFASARTFGPQGSYSELWRVR